MRKLVTSLLVASAFTMAPSVSHAQSLQTGEDLLQACRIVQDIGKGNQASDSVKLTQSGWCLGVVGGAQELMSELTEYDVVAPEYQTCALDQTRGAVVDVVVNTLEANPEIRSRSAATIAAAAIQSAFPCP